MSEAYLLCTQISLEESVSKLAGHKENESPCFTRAFDLIFNEITFYLPFLLKLFSESSLHM